MTSLVYLGKKLHLCKDKSFKSIIKSSLHTLVFQVNPFRIQLAYFLLSVIGFLALKVSNPRTSSSSSSASFELKNIDIFFTSVSSATVSSMSTVEMEVFSNTQLIIMTILMLLGGEVFTSMLELQLLRFKLHTTRSSPANVNSIHLVSTGKQETDVEADNCINSSSGIDSLKHSSIKSLSYVVLAYLLVVHIGGSSLVALYTSLVPSARKILTNKGLYVQTFSTFTVVSTFSNCGFVPTNENMIIFKKNSGLLLLVFPLTLLGNTLYPPSLRFVIWVLEKITKKVEYKYMLKNSKEMGYDHLMPSLQSWFLVLTVFGFIVVQLVVFLSMEWGNSVVMGGLNWVEKVVAAVFQVVSTRHSGEYIADISILSPAMLVIFIVMMYLPPYTTFLPITKKEEETKSKKQKKTMVQCLLFSQLSYLAIFIVLICIVEREKLKTDPLNFSVLNITLEVISAYGNVGYSTGYSCGRQLKPDNSCQDAWYGFAGRWSNLGKIILMIVMFFGRLKKFSNNSGKAWKLS